MIIFKIIIAAVVLLAVVDLALIVASAKYSSICDEEIEINDDEITEEDEELYNIHIGQELSEDEFYPDEHIW